MWCEIVSVTFSVFSFLPYSYMYHSDAHQIGYLKEGIHMVRNLSKLLKGYKERRPRPSWTGYDHAHFLLVQAILLEVNHSGSSFVCVQSQRGYNLDNINYSLTFRRVWVILRSVLEIANYLRQSSEHLGWTWSTYLHTYYYLLINNKYILLKKTRIYIHT